MKKILLGLFSLSLLSISCKKSKDAPAQQPVTIENIAGTYKLTSATVGSSPSDTYDIYANMSACNKDNLYILHSDNTFHYKDAGTQCDPVGDYDDVWTLEGNDIRFGEEMGTITKFDGTNMEITANTPTPGQVYKANYRKQ